MQQQPDVSDLWIQHQRRHNRTTFTWSCIFCPARRIFTTEPALWEHARADHKSRLPLAEDTEAYRKQFAEECAQKKPTRDDSSPRKPSYNDANKAQPEPPPGPQGKRPLSSPAPRSLSGLGALNLGTPGSQEVNVDMQDSGEHEQAAKEQPRKRAAIGDGISAGSASPRRDSSASPPPRRSNARPTSAPYKTPDEPRRDMFDSRPNVGRKQLWTEDDAPLRKASFVDPSNIASIQAQRSRAQALQPRPRRSFPSNQQSPTSNPTSNPSILGRNALPALQARDENYDIVLQPETRPISQEQLVAEVKGIYAGLVMVEAKCIEVGTQQATLAQADPSAQPKLNNEQWQALIALHRTLLHEHHDFFLASQHPSASAALRRLATKYAMPARMWRHGIHSFLELLRHRLPASLDHMLAFIYLAYSMMALLYETVPAFEDTWIECLGDLGRYRMAIEDDDIRDREVWTGVSRHWYSKASDKTPTTGRLYHHLAILARPNALQQLFYYAKSLCVVIPFISARDSILTLFDPVLSPGNINGQYRLPPLDTAFVKAHGLLFTNREVHEFDTTAKEFLDLLDDHIGRVTRRFMEQGCYVAVTNSVAMLGFAAKDNPLVQAMTESAEESDVEMTSMDSPPMTTFKRAQNLSNETVEIVLRRIGDPNVLPFIHVTLVFMHHMARYPRAIQLLAGSFPWQALTIMLNTLLAPYSTPDRIESTSFPLPIKDDVRPFPEDYAMRGLLWAENYYPEKWFFNDKSDDAEKDLEVASMTDERKERILFLACRLASMSDSLHYDGSSKRFSASVPCAESPAT
ncbi:hypothetical protein QTJ16_005889 [Diplocarpon rosae]|uniref:DNA/RNA-binding domain-containing protein n=1 Tax=Diplocarpon rosae TaxID=946125 RepID=A0AAD9SVX4_9HELO|nr:hypothetical protein QTJ16_005889 [Diplocarpon rosae]